MITDAHTHNLEALDAIIAVEQQHFDPRPGRVYSIGIHPWNSATATEAHWLQLQQCARHPQVVAIGETGLDSLRGAPLARQTELFEQHLLLAQQLAKPIIIHSVRTSQQVLAACRRLGVSMPIAIHGMRGNERVARPLIEAGFYLSFGQRFNTATVLTTPRDHLLIETDDSGMPIHDIATLLSSTLGLPPADILALAASNLQRFLALNT